MNIDKRIETAQWKVYLAKKKESKIQEKLQEYRDYHKLHGPKLKPLKIIHEVVVTVDSPSDVSTKLQLNYLVFALRSSQGDFEAVVAVAGVVLEERAETFRQRPPAGQAGKCQLN